MTKPVLVLTFVISCCLLLPPARCHSFVVDYLKGEDSLTGIRFAFRPASDQPPPIFADLDIGYYSEFSLIAWHLNSGGKKSINTAVSLSPVITGFINHGKTLAWEFGIGLSLVDDTDFAGKNIGSHFQFEDRIGFTYWPDQDEAISIRYMHYSNGGLNSHNPGMDFISISYIFSF